jgi:hypothetical protein
MIFLLLLLHLHVEEELIGNVVDRLGMVDVQEELSNFYRQEEDLVDHDDD